MIEQKKIIRTIKSFVKREGRMTEAQRRAFEQLWPRYGISFQEQATDFSNLYQNPLQPLVLEIGFGMGQSLFEMATQHPEVNFLGIEVFKTGIGALLVKLEKQPLNNLRIIHADACDVLNQMLITQSLDGIQIFFPDPWRKKRHHKRRLIQVSFIELLLKRLKNNGFIHIATDWEDYALHIQEVFKSFPTLNANSIPKLQRPITKYETRGRKLGHSVWEFFYLKPPS